MMSATPTPELPFKECGTPDTVWGADVSHQGFRFTAWFPVPLIKDSETRAFINEMHAAMLPVVERLYERRWAQMLAGKRDKEGRPYPMTYAELWPTQAQSREVGE